MGGGQHCGERRLAVAGALASQTVFLRGSGAGQIDTVRPVCHYFFSIDEPTLGANTCSFIKILESL